MYQNKRRDKEADMMLIARVQITVTEPKVSAARSSLTRPFLLRIACIPLMRIIVTAMGRPPGIAARAITSAYRSKSVFTALATWFCTAERGCAMSQNEAYAKSYRNCQAQLLDIHLGNINSSETRMLFGQ
jgi:hypothetical protein